VTGFAAAAMRVTALNVASNVLLLLGNAYAARCLGAANFGVSAQVMVAVQQASLAFNGGLDTVAVRQVASGHESAAATGRAVLVFRLLISLPLALAWVAWVLSTHDPGPLRNAWLLGAPLVVLASLQLSFLFQAMDRLPRWAALTATSSLLIALAYGVSFHPGMPVGADLWVTASVGALVTAASVVHGLRLAGFDAAGVARGWRDGASVVMRLLAQSWRYWLLALLVFVYTAFPIVLVARMQDDAAAGILRVCLQFAAGLEVVFASINSLLLPRLVRWQREGNDTLRANQRRQLASHGLMGVAAFVAAAAAAPFIFNTLLGPQFQAGLVPFLLLAASRVVVFVGQVYAWGVVALRLDGALLGATLCGALTSLALNLALVPRYSLTGAAVAALAAEVVIVSLCFIVQRRHLSRDASSGAAGRST
jgi:O-antigen/teichoic acid export membrane protein